MKHHPSLMIPLSRLTLSRKRPTHILLAGGLLLCTSYCAPSVEATSKTDIAPAMPGKDATWCKAALMVPDELASDTRHVSQKEQTIDVPQASGRSTSPIFSLSLSGGGYRAMLFHIGTLRRLNDSGLLPRISVVSSVSGGSITAAYLAYRWLDLRFDPSDRATNFDEIVETPLRTLSKTTLDISSIILGMLPFSSSSKQQVAQFDKHLFQGAVMTAIAPGGNGVEGTRPRPLFVLNATSLQTGELWQFRWSAMGGPIAGWTSTGKVRLSEAVAASSGFPPLLSPLTLELPNTDVRADWHDCSDYRDNPYGIHHRNEPGRVLPSEDEALTGYRRKVYLIDGGVRDNLGISTIEEINRLRRLGGNEQITASLISDGGATTAFEGDPSSNWLSQGNRILTLLSDQPDEVRVANIIRTSSFRLRKFGWLATETTDNCPNAVIPQELNAARYLASIDSSNDAYAYWSIRRRPKLHRGFECPTDIPSWMVEEVRLLSSVPTAFRAMSDELQARLINWGYLAAHHGIPYVDAAWPDAIMRQRWLGTCSLPYGPEVTDPAGSTPTARDARCLGFASAGNTSEDHVK